MVTPIAGVWWIRTVQSLAAARVEIGGENAVRNFRRRYVCRDTQRGQTSGFGTLQGWWVMMRGSRINGLLSSWLGVILGARIHFS